VIRGSFSVTTTAWTRKADPRAKGAAGSLPSSSLGPIRKGSSSRLREWERSSGPNYWDGSVTRISFVLWQVCAHSAGSFLRLMPREWLANMAGQRSVAMRALERRCSWQLITPDAVIRRLPERSAA
jgi:hypothetical protein